MPLEWNRHKLAACGYGEISKTLGIFGNLWESLGIYGESMANGGRSRCAGRDVRFKTERANESDRSVCVLSFGGEAARRSKAHGTNLSVGARLLLSVKTRNLWECMGIYGESMGNLVTRECR